MNDHKLSVSVLIDNDNILIPQSCIGFFLQVNLICKSVLRSISIDIKSVHDLLLVFEFLYH